MTSTTSAETHPAPRKYSSPPHALIWFFRKSRDNWKRKYLAVKVQLKLACRRRARLDQAKPSSPPAAANPAQSPASSCPLASFRDFLQQQVDDLQQQVQANREVLQQCQQQNRLLEDLAQQINRHQQRLDSAFAPASASSPPPVQPLRPAAHAAAKQPLPKIPHQAPQEPKKGVSCQYRH